MGICFERMRSWDDTGSERCFFYYVGLYICCRLLILSLLQGPILWSSDDGRKGLKFANCWVGSSVWCEGYTTEFGVFTAVRVLSSIFLDIVDSWNDLDECLEPWQTDRRSWHGAQVIQSQQNSCATSQLNVRYEVPCDTECASTVHVLWINLYTFESCKALFETAVYNWSHEYWHTWINATEAPSICDALQKLKQTNNKKEAKEKFLLPRAIAHASICRLRVRQVRLGAE
jgi:hypothetical protein